MSSVSPSDPRLVAAGFADELNKLGSLARLRPALGKGMKLLGPAMTAAFAVPHAIGVGKRVAQPGKLHR